MLEAESMYETKDDLAWLQELLDRTLARANPDLASIVAPERRLNARQVVRYLQGTKHVAFGTVNACGEALMLVEPSSMWATPSIRSSPPSSSPEQLACNVEWFS